MAAGEASSGNDFFLQFGSDADIFSAQLVEELPKGQQAILDLKAALEGYEEVAARVANGKITFNFDGLTAAADRIESATTQFTRQFGSQLTQLTSKVAGLAETLRTAERSTSSGTAASNGHRPARSEEIVETGPARPPLRPRPPEPKPPKDPYGKTLPDVLEKWPGAPKATQDGKADPKQQALYDARVKKYISSLSPEDQEIARKHESVMASFDAEMKKFSADYAAWAKQVRAIDAANEKVIKDWETTHGQSWNGTAPTAPAAPPQRRPIREVPAEPTRPQQPQMPQSLADKGFRAPPAQESDRYEKQYDLFQSAHPDLAAAADEYRDLVEEFHQAEVLFKTKYAEWEKAKAVIERANAEAQAFNASLPGVQEPAAGAQAPVAPASATRVPEADLDAVRAAKREALAEEQQAVKTLAEFSVGLATSSKAVEDALTVLAGRLTDGASKLPEAGSGAGAEGSGSVQQVEVVNGEADAVPVVLIGGEEQVHEGKGKSGEPHKATTATATAKAVEELHDTGEKPGSISEPHVVPPAGPQKSAAEEVSSAVTPVAAALTETVRSIEQWQSLSESRRERLERNGIDQQAYLSGAPLGAAGGKSPVPAAQRAYDQAVSRAGANLDDEELARFNPYEHPEVAEAAERLQRAHAEQAAVDAARARRAAAAAAPAPAPEPPAEPASTASTHGNPFARFGEGDDDLHAPGSKRPEQFARLAPATQRAISEARDQLSELSKLPLTDETRSSMEQIVAQAAHVFRQDPKAGYKYTDSVTGKKVDNSNHIIEGFGGSPGATRAFGDFMGLSQGRQFLRNRVFPEGGLADGFNEARAASPAGAGVAGANSSRVDKMSDAEKIANAEELAKIQTILAATHGEVTTAALAHAKAEADLARVQSAEIVDADALNAALRRLQATERGLSSARETQAREEGVSPTQSAYQRFKGTNATFGQDIRRHLANTGLNQIGYSLSFIGFDKMKELVDTGIQAQAVFVRLQASLDANHISAGNLQTELAKISATTATPLDHVLEAAAELSGTFKNVGDIEFGTKIASQLANISQGTLSAQQAAVGLRDVFAAFGDDWAKTGMTVKEGLQQTGDQIAHLSQLTGVSVKDITEGTTQIAAEAHEFGLNQGQTATLAAYIAKGTGESGEESAAQASRMFATLYNGKTQNVLEQTRLYDKHGNPEKNPDGSPKTLATSQQFASGDLGDILGSIAGSWADLSARQRQAITAQMGTGIQARAFEALVGGGKDVQKELNGSANDSGTLARQNQAFLATVEGQIKQLDEDFQNLGNTLQRIGAFDVIGLLAKSLDSLFKNINRYVGAFSSLMNSNPLTAGIMHTSSILVEAAVAWKLFGSSLSRGLLRRRTQDLVPLNQRAINEANANGIKPPAPTYAFRDVYRATRSGAWGSVGNRFRRTGSLINDVAHGNRADLTPAGLAARGNVAGAKTTQANVIAAYGKAYTAEIAATEKVTVAETEHAAAADALAKATREGTASETEMNILRARQMRAQELLTTATKEAAAAQAEVASMAAAVVKSEADLAAANAAQAGVRQGGVRAGFQGSGGRLLGAAGFGAFMLGGPIGDTISGGQSASSGARGMAGHTIGGAMTYAGMGGMIGGPWGAAIGGIYGVGKGLYDGVMGARNRRDALPSGKSDQDYLDMMNLVYNNKGSQRAVKGAKSRLGYGNSQKLGIDQLDKLTSDSAVNSWADAETAFIKKHAKDIEKAGGNNKTAQKAMAGQINTLIKNLQKDATNRIATIDGLSKIDQLNATQLQAFTSVAGSLAGFDGNTIKTQGAGILTLLQNSGLPTTSTAYKSLATAMGVGTPLNTLGLNDKGMTGQYNSSGKWVPADPSDLVGMSTTERGKLPQLGAAPRAGGATARMAALQKGYEAAIKAANSKLNSPGLSGADRTSYGNSLLAAMSGYQQVTQSMYGTPVQQQQGRAAVYAAQGGTTPGSDAVAVSALSAANKDLKNYNRHLETTDPQYWSNLQSIQQNKLQIAQLQAQPQLNALGLAAAQATDATAQASLKYQQAVRQLGIDQAGGANSKTIGDDRIAIAAAGVGQRQTAENVTEATAQAHMAGVENNVQKARLQYADAMRRARVYSKGGSLADKANEQQAIAEAKQAEIAISQGILADSQAAWDVASAIASMHGDAVGAANDQLKKALQTYRYMVAHFGKTSQQARDAHLAVIQQDQALWSAQLDEQNSTLDLQIAQLNARGQSGDAEKAAQDQVKKIKNQIASYLKHGGKKNVKAYKDLQGQLATAQRNAFDVGLQAEMDTLDFQQQTYKITSAQEVQALQQILKNKQLTLQEQRDITLKIKNLQDSIRQQLTQGGLNIPSNITLPTAYDVRRSLGAGFGGAASQQATVNNNQQVTINNNVASHAQVADIVKQVVHAVNSTFGRQVRASTSTPRVVATK